MHTIWQMDTQSQTCPETLDFLVPMPSSYSEGSRIRPLPPSYQVMFPGVPGLFADAVYTIRIYVTKFRKLLWKKTFVYDH